MLRFKCVYNKKVARNIVGSDSKGGVGAGHPSFAGFSGAGPIQAGVQFAQGQTWQHLGVMATASAMVIKPFVMSAVLGLFHRPDRVQFYSPAQVTRLSRLSFNLVLPRTIQSFNLLLVAQEKLVKVATGRLFLIVPTRGYQFGLE
ncbi:hypothetical protein TSMEX_004900, partial [Taenia solium]